MEGIFGKTVVDEVRHWTMNDMHSVVRQERNVTLCQKYVVSRQKPGTQRSHRLQKRSRAHFIILQAEADLILMLTQVHMNARV